MFQFKGPISSRDLELFVTKTNEDIAFLINKVKYLENSQIRELRSEEDELVSQSNITSDNYKLAEVQNSGIRKQIKQLAEALDITVPDSRTLFATMHSPKVFSGTINWLGGYATLAESSRISLLSIYRDGEVFPIRGLTFSITQEEGVGKVTENDFQNCITQTEPYVRDLSILGVSPDVVRFTSEITIPANVLNGAEANLIEVVPYPIGVSKIEDITIESVGGGTRKLNLSNLTELNLMAGVAIPINPGVIGKIKVTISNPAGKSFYYAGSIRKCSYGISKIALYKISYTTQGYFKSRFSLKDGKKIDSIASLFYNTDTSETLHELPSGNPALVLKVLSDSGNGSLSEVFDSSSFPGGNISEEPIKMPDNTKFVEIHGLIRGSGQGIPPRVYNVMAIVNALDED